MSAAVQRLVAAQSYGMRLRPRVGGFPVLAKVLHDAGVHSNEWHLPSTQSIYLTDLGAVVQQQDPLETGTFAIAPFDRDAVIRAIWADQSGVSTFPAFLRAVWDAGVVRYVADFDARTVTYLAVDGSSHVESYPDVALPQAPDACESSPDS